MIESFVLVGGLLTILLVNRRLNDQERRLAALEALARTIADPRAAAPAPSSAGPAPQTGFVADLPVPPEPALARPESAGRDEEARPTPPPTVPPIPVAPPVAAPARPGLEELLGTRWTVWVGGIALALGGLFLVRYSIEQELLGPGVRVMLGLALAAALVGAGEWLRRRDPVATGPSAVIANVPAVLTAAGTSTAFASIYAAYGLYGLIGPAVAFLALGAVSFVTMTAAILHGPALAGLGLVAALAAPVLVESRDPSPIALVLYLVFATGTAYAVARLKLWRWLAIAAAVGGWLWGAVLLAMGAGWNGAAVAHTVVQLALALMFLLVDPYRGAPAGEARTDRFATLVLFAFALLAAVSAVDLGAGLSRPAVMLLVVGMLLGTAWAVPAGASGAAAAAFATLVTLLLWPVIGEALREPTAIVADLASAPAPQALTAYIMTALLLNGLVAGVSLLRVAAGRGLQPGIAAWYVGAATVGPLLSLVVAYWRLTFFAPSIPFALVAAALAAGFAVVTGWLATQDRDGSPAIRLAVGATASAAVAALAAGLTFAFDRGVLTVALALAALGTAVIADRVRIPALRYVVGALAVAVAARLAWDPTVMRGEIGTTPIVNWLLWGYGIPALAFGLAARILSRTARDNLARFVEGVALLFAALLVFLEIRHALHAGAPFAARSSHLEAGLVVTEMLGFTLLLTRLDLRRPDPLYRAASLVFATLSLLGAGLALGIAYNPFLSGEPVIGGLVFNSLLPAYLIPAGLAAAVAIAGRHNRPYGFVLAASALAILLQLAYSCLEVRFLFHGPRIGIFRSTSQAEMWSYSLVLLVEGLGLLALGILRDWRIARLASLACIVVAVLKVFVVDMSALEGLTRAFSFVGLGLTLVMIGLVYQRVLARTAHAD